MDKELLKFENVSYSVRGKEIVLNINWSVKKGEHWAIIGPNGAGKSTLIRLIYGFLWPNSSGNVYRKGIKNSNLGELRKSIGLVSGDLIKRIPSGEIVLQTVISGKYAMLGFWTDSVLGLNKIDNEQAYKIMEKLGILGLGERITQTLSHGEIQKVLLARALMSNPYLILLDEPLDGFDPGAQESFLDTLGQYISNNDEPAFIYVTHHIDEIIDGFKKILMIKSGEILYKGNIAEGLSSQRISELYDHSFKLIYDNKRYHIVKS